MHATMPSSKSQPKLPACYPISLRSGIPAIFTGAAILLSLGAVAFLWPALVHQQIPTTIEPSAFWELVVSSVATFTAH